jgi:hypothetical protein
MSERAANRARMEELVERWRRSGAPVSVFARKHRISRDKLVYWRRRLGGGEGSAKMAELVPVRLIGPGSTGDSRLEVVLGNGDRVLVPESTPVELLRDVVSVLRGC